MDDFIRALYGVARYGESYYGVTPSYTAEVPIIVDVSYKYNKPSLMADSKVTPKPSLVSNDDKTSVVVSNGNVVDKPRITSQSQTNKPVLTSNTDTIKKKYLVDSY